MQPSAQMSCEFIPSPLQRVATGFITNGGLATISVVCMLTMPSTMSNGWLTKFLGEHCIRLPVLVPILFASDSSCTVHLHPAPLEYLTAASKCTCMQPPLAPEIFPAACLHATRVMLKSWPLSACRLAMMPGSLRPRHTTRKEGPCEEVKGSRV
jgi:hypothetical protein